MNDRNNVLSGRLATGGVHFAPVGTAAPTDASTPLPVGWISGGFTGNDGITLAPDTEVGEWIDHNGRVIKKFVTSHKEVLTIPFYESSLAVLRVNYGNDWVTVDPDGVIHVRSTDTLPEMHAWAIDLADGPDAQRIYAEFGQVVSKPELTFNVGDPINYTVDVELFVGTDGVWSHRWIEIGGGLAA